jgi:hypothetical protein
MSERMRKLTSTEQTLLTASFQELGTLFLGACDSLGHSRELSIAKTKMEEAIMWAVKGVTA